MEYGLKLNNATPLAIHPATIAKASQYKIITLTLSGSFIVGHSRSGIFSFRKNVEDEADYR